MKQKKKNLNIKPYSHMNTFNIKKSLLNMDLSKTFNRNLNLDVKDEPKKENLYLNYIETDNNKQNENKNKANNINKRRKGKERTRKKGKIRKSKEGKGIKRKIEKRRKGKERTRKKGKGGKSKFEIK